MSITGTDNFAKVLGCPISARAQAKMRKGSIRIASQVYFEQHYEELMKKSEESGGKEWVALRVIEEEGKEPEVTVLFGNTYVEVATEVDNLLAQGFNAERDEFYFDGFDELRKPNSKEE